MGRGRARDLRSDVLAVSTNHFSCRSGRSGKPAYSPWSQMPTRMAEEPEAVRVAVVEVLQPAVDEAGHHGQLRRKPEPLRRWRPSTSRSPPAGLVAGIAGRLGGPGRRGTASGPEVRHTVGLDPAVSHSSMYASAAAAPRRRSWRRRRRPGPGCAVPRRRTPSTAAGPAVSPPCTPACDPQSLVTVPASGARTASPRGPGTHAPMYDRLFRTRAPACAAGGREEELCIRALAPRQGPRAARWSTRARSRPRPR